MTQKLNLNPLIKHFEAKSPTISKRLLSLTKTAERSTKTSFDKAELARVQKIAQVLVEIADELDHKEPELASEADSLLKELTHECGEHCMGGHSDQPMMLVMDGGQQMMGHGGQMLMDDHDHDGEEEITIEELKDPEIEEVKEPEPEFDHVSLEDIKDQIANMKFRIADKKRKEALQNAIEHIEKAMEYHNASKKRKDKVHSIFDEAGLALRLKDFE